MHTYQNYLVIISPPFIPTAASASATVRNFVARTANAGESDITKVTVFDPENRLVAYTGTFTQGVREIVTAWGQLYVLSNNGTVCIYQVLAVAVADSPVALLAPREVDLDKAGNAV